MINQRLFGATGRNVSVIGQGTWDIEKADRSAVIQALRKGLELGMTHIDTAVLPWCASHNIALTAYSPFGQGRFPSPHSTQGRLLQKIADAHRATPRQVALQFLIRHDAVFTIPKASTVDHVQENAAASALRLEAADIEALEKAFPKPKKDTPLPML